MPTKYNDLDIFIGARLKRQRQKLGISQSNLAEKLEVSHQLIQKQEAGQTRISASMLYQLASYLNVSPAYFYEGYVPRGDVSKSLPEKGDIIRNSIKTEWNVLLIEDNPEDEILFRKCVKELETSEKQITIHVAHDKTEAIDFLRNRSDNAGRKIIPDLIFLDLNLPRIDGFTILKEIKQDRDLRFIPVIILTNSVNAEEMLKSYYHFSSGYVCKSFDLHIFREKVGHILNYWTKAVLTPQNY